MRKKAAIVEAVEAKPVLAPNSAETADKNLVEGVVQKIHAILHETATRGMDEVGRLLLKEFFNDDPSLYTSVSHSKHASLKLLLERCETLDLPVRRTFLANALQMAVFSRRLPEDSVFPQLPPSHRIELLRLGSPEKAETMAATAIEKRMTVKKIRAVVHKEKEKNKSNRGRKPTPEILKAVGSCVATLKDEGTGRLAFKKDDVGELSEEQREQLRGMIEALGKRVEELGRLLEKA